MTIKTIGTATRDYSTIQAWEDACPDLVATTQTWIGQCYNDSVLGGFTVTGNTTSATYYMELTTAAGQSFKDHANKLTNALKYNSSNGVALYSAGTYANMCSITQAYFSMSNLMIRQADASGTTRTIDVSDTSTNFTISNCIVENEGSDLCLILRASTQKAVNCLFAKTTANGTSGGAVAAQGGSDIYSCTVVKTSDAADSGTGISSYNGDATVTNTAMFGFTTAMQSTGFIDSNYNASDQAPADSGPNDVDNLTYTSQFENTTNAAYDFRVKSGSGLVAGTRDATNTSDLDIIGQARSTTTPTIGCWEFVSSGVSGTIAVTLDAFTSAITGTSTVIGTIANTLENTTGTLQGTSTVVGTMAVTLEDTTSSITGTTTIVGTIAQTLEDFYSSISGFIGVQTARLLALLGVGS